MYALWVQRQAAGGRALEFEDWTRGSFATMKTRPGFVRATLTNSLGNPFLYHRFSVWETREACKAAINSDEYRAYLKKLPEGLYTSVAPAEGYDVVLEVASAGQAQYVVSNEWTLDNRPGNAAAFESSRKELFELRQQHTKGFVANRMYRFLGAPNRYLISISFDTLENLRGWAAGAVAQVQQYTLTHPASNYASTPPSSQYAEIVLRS